MLRYNQILVCEKCGKRFRESDLYVIQESRGEYWGADAYEDEYVSPCCHADFFNEDSEGETTYSADDEADFRYHEMRDMECIEYAF